MRTGRTKGTAIGLATILVVLALAACFLSLRYGSWPLTGRDVAEVLSRKLLGRTSRVDDVLVAIVWDGRLPRFIVGFLAGFSLAAAGALMQSIFKNPMASPGVLGISSGAALGAVLSIYLGLASRSLMALPLSAIAFSLLTLLLVFMIATSKGYTSVPSLLLAGIALNLVFGALTSFVLTLGTHEFDVGKVILTWLMGDLSNRSWEHAYVVCATTVIGLVPAIFFMKDLNILMHGEETAANFGVNIDLVRNSLLLCSSVMTGGAIAVSGVVGFVGLICPHMVRGLTGPDNRTVLPLSGLLGGILIVYADLFLRCAVHVDLRIGVLTTLLGGPFFLYLIVTNRKRFEYL